MLMFRSLVSHRHLVGHRDPAEGSSYDLKFCALLKKANGVGMGVMHRPLKGRPVKVIGCKTVEGSCTFHSCVEEGIAAGEVCHASSICWNPSLIQL